LSMFMKLPGRATHMWHAQLADCDGPTLPGAHVSGLDWQLSVHFLIGSSTVAAHFLAHGLTNGLSKLNRFHSFK
ncbi:MAG: hypothetical protein ACPG53_05970, partial [Schleiferiaceae bacterium]